MNRIIALALAVVAAVAVTFAVIAWSAASAAQGQSTHDRGQLMAQAREITALQGAVARLAGDVSNPSDPLSAYTDVCNVQLTNDQTGVNQTYYYPCTNQAQVTPQPGG